MGYTLGIDIGTTYSCAAIHRNGHTEIVALGHNSSIVPSAVLVEADNRTIVGDAALRRSVDEPGRLARHFKRRMGDAVPIFLGGAPFSAESLTARLLRHVADAVVEQQGGPPDAVAVTRPANWGPYKQEQFGEALRLAGLPAALTLSEPEAAALAYAATERIPDGAAVAIYDLGGGTFDAAVLRHDGGRFELIGRPEGLERLGGIDFDVTDAFYDRMLSVDPSLTDVAYGPEAYDAVIITALAAVEAGTDDPAAIARSVNGITRDGEPCGRYADCVALIEEGTDVDYDGPSGAQQFSQPGEPSTAAYAVLRYGEDNRVDDAATEYRMAQLH